MTQKKSAKKKKPASGEKLVVKEPAVAVPAAESDSGDMVSRKVHDLLAAKRVEENEAYLKESGRLQRKISGLQEELEEEREKKKVTASCAAQADPYAGLSKVETTVDEMFASAEVLRERISEVDASEKVIIFGSDEVIGALKGKEKEK